MLFHNLILIWGDQDGAMSVVERTARRIVRFVPQLDKLDRFQSSIYSEDICTTCGDLQFILVFTFNLDHF